MSDFEDPFYSTLQFEDSNSLGEICRLELTLNHPRTAAFRRASEAEQRLIYDKWIDDSLSVYFDRISKMDRFYELCRSGMVHVHLDLHLVPREQYYPCGLVSDIVKEFLSHLPKRHGIKTFSLLNYNCNFRRYRCPSIVCQLRDASEARRSLLWEEYIRKSQ